MEEVSTKQMLEEEIRTLVERLRIVTPGSDAYGDIVRNIRELVNSYNELDKTETEKADKDRHFAEEIRFKDQELHYKDQLERDKLSEEKIRNLRDSIIKIASVVLTVTPTVALSLLGLKLEFIDHGSICTFGVKELLKKASQTVKMV